jgi:hypothetical protein
MTETTRCPYCGCPRESALDSLYQEIARIREIAERGAAKGARPAPCTGPAAGPADHGTGLTAAPADHGTGLTAAPADQSAGAVARIAELTREVHELRATVARLRGSSAPWSSGRPAPDAPRLEASRR